MDTFRNSIFPAVAVGIYPLFVVLLPILSVSFGEVSPALQKGIIAAWALAITFILAGLALLFLLRRNITLLLYPLQLVGVPLFVVGVLSALRVASPEMAWWGIGLELGTVGSLFLFAYAIIAGFFVSRRAVLLFLYVFVGATTVAAIHALTLAFLGEIGGRFFTLAGEWTQLSFLIAGALLVVIVLFDLERRVLYRLSFAGLSILLLVGFLFFFHRTAGITLLVVLLVAAPMVWWARTGSKYRFPIGICVTSLVLFLLLVWGMRNPVLSLPLDVRPSLLLTELITVPAYVGHPLNALIGTGPDTFPMVWEQYRPQEFNNTPFWDVAFESAYSTAATFAVTLGILGLCAFLFVPVVILLSAFRRRHEVISGSDDGRTLVAVLALSIFCFLAAVFYTSGIVVLLLEAITLGFAAHFLFTKGWTWHVPATALVRIPTALLLATAGVGLMWISGHQWSAASNHTRGVQLFEEGEVVEAVPLLERAVESWGTSLYARDAARATLGATLKAVEEGAGIDVVRAEVARALTLSDRSVASGSKEYATWISRASLHLALLSAGVTDTDAEVRTALEQARFLAPTRPEPLYLLAVFENELGNRKAALNALEEALHLKPDYEEALRLRDRLLVE